MIIFDKLWVLMKKKGVSTYQLRERCGIDSKTIRRLRATVDAFCYNHYFWTSCAPLWIANWRTLRNTERTARSFEVNQEKAPRRDRRGAFCQSSWNCPV